MTTRDKLADALSRIGVRIYDAVWITNCRGAPRNFAVTIAGATFRGSTLRGVLRAIDRQRVSNYGT